ncbi:hypothetical protein [Dendronalium sp. ChiSLP03b]|uniref:hypothetical protein n=1 Tax=Dendronalium sp. ChiSLP03b TaxID=3075381 RepID=UPI00391BF3D1
MSAKIDANRERLEAAYKWLAFKVNPLLLMGCIVIPAFVGSYVYTSWQQTKNLSQSPFVEIKDLPLRCGEGSE